MGCGVMHIGYDIFVVRIAECTENTEDTEGKG